MEILLWLVPAAVVTLLAAWVAARAARREEEQRLAREQVETPAQEAPVVVDDEDVSAPRPARRPAPRSDGGDQPGHGQRRSA